MESKRGTPTEPFSDAKNIVISITVLVGDYRNGFETFLNPIVTGDLEKISRINIRC